VIAFRAAASNAANTASLVVTIPAAVQVGDIMVVQVFGAWAPYAITTPAGWTVIRDDVNSANGHQSVYRKVAVSGDTGGAATVTFVQSTSMFIAANLVAYSGVNPATPINAQGATTSSASGDTTVTAPSATSTLPNTMVLDLFGMYTGGAAGITFTVPAVLRSSAQDASPNVVGKLCDQALAATGASGSQVATAVGGTVSNWVATTLILAPAAAAPGAQPAAIL
jgi:hypothetical protein